VPLTPILPSLVVHEEKRQLWLLLKLPFIEQEEEKIAKLPLILLPLASSLFPEQKQEMVQLLIAV
jgi:hypothetical protein